VNSSPLAESSSVVLDGSGKGTLRMRPLGGSETWLLSAVSVKTNQASVTSEAQCRIYAGPSATDAYFTDGTLSGSTGDSTDRVSGLQVDTHGNYLWAVWTGGDPGARGVMVAYGTRQVP
jgi:hypothetical protein